MLLMTAVTLEIEVVNCKLIIVERQIGQSPQIMDLHISYRDP